MKDLRNQEYLLLIFQYQIVHITFWFIVRQPRQYLGVTATRFDKIGMRPNVCNCQSAASNGRDFIEVITLIRVFN